MPRLAELLAYFNSALVIMPEHETAFHNDINDLQKADVRQGIAADRDQVAETSFSDGSNISIPANDHCGN